MKKKFSKKWEASRQPRKQRKYRANAPLHIRHKFMSANLKKDLRKKYGRRSFPLRKEDSIRVMRGEFKKRTGKIALVDLKKLRVAVEGIQRTKKDGTKVNVWFAPSNLQIQELNLDDKKRRMAIERGAEKIETKPIIQKISSEKKSSLGGKSDNKNKQKGEKQNATS